MPPQSYKEVCASCGLTFGAHRGDSIIHNQCPKHEGRMDWPDPAKNERVTTFQPTGNFDPVPYGTASRHYQHEKEA